MKYDLIMVAASRDRALIDMTQRSIDTCLNDGAEVNVILIETFEKHEYRGVNELILYDEPFNYNRCLNTGLKHRKNDVQILANNDLVFVKGWSVIGEEMKEYGILSASAISDSVFHRGLKVEKGMGIPGYEISKHFTGWCLFQDAKIWDKVSKLDERFEFWYSDNIHAEQLQRAKIEHWLLCCAQVNHVTSQTLNKIDRQTRNRYIRAPRQILHRNR